MQGRVYVHTGKGLKSAKITFDNSNIDHYKRLGYQSSVRHHKRRSEVSPSKHISQTEDAQDDVILLNLGRVRIWINDLILASDE